MERTGGSSSAWEISDTICSAWVISDTICSAWVISDTSYSVWKIRDTSCGTLETHETSWRYVTPATVSRVTSCGRMVTAEAERNSGWRRPKTRTVMPRAANHKANGGGATSNGSTPSTPIGQNQQVSTNQTPSSPPDMPSTNKNKNKKEKEANKKKGRSKEVMIHEPAVLIEGVLFRARYLGSTQLVSEGQPTKTTRMMQAEEAVSRIK
ncbi:lin-10-like 2, partial [Homarus americanus]